MNDHLANHQFVECFVIDDATHEVLLSASHIDKDGLWGGLKNYLNENVQDPIYSAIATTQEHINCLIPPSEWILLGTHKTSSSTTVLFATTWDLSRMKYISNNLLRVPLGKIKNHSNINPYVKDLLSSFGSEDSAAF